MSKKPQYKELPVDQIFLDCQKERIHVRDEENPKGVRVDHKDGYFGYQRDPWTRLKWIESRLESDGFDDRKFRPLDVSKRRDGTYACMDGGGRWVMAQLLGLKTVPCIVHEGLTLEEEAELFTQYDSETYKLRSIDRFIAYLGAGDPMVVAINDAVAPFQIAAKGPGTLKCVGPLAEIYTAFGNYHSGIRHISRTAKIVANTWCGFKGGGQWGMRKQLDGKFFLAVAIVIEIAGKDLDEGALRRAMSRLSPKDIQHKIDADFPTAKINQDAFTILAAKKLATHYNRAANLTDDDRIVATDVDNSSIVESMLEGRTFSARQRETREAAKAAKKRAA